MRQSAESRLSMSTFPALFAAALTVCPNMSSTNLRFGNFSLPPDSASAMALSESCSNVWAGAEAEPAFFSTGAAFGWLQFAFCAGARDLRAHKCLQSARCVLHFFLGDCWSAFQAQVNDRIVQTTKRFLLCMGLFSGFIAAGRLAAEN